MLKKIVDLFIGALLGILLFFSLVKMISLASGARVFVYQGF
jgi:hypothetical protein